MLPSPKNLSTGQVDRLVETLFSNNDEPKLKGRSVLIPFSKQAFLEGELDPTTTTADGEKAQEQVRVVVDSQIQTVTTGEAKLWLEQYSSGKQTKKTTTVNDKEPTIQPPLPRQKSKKHNPKAVIPSPPPDLSFGGFVEIQEEYNADGKQVRGNAIDVSRQLNEIWKNASEPPLQPTFVMSSQEEESDMINSEEKELVPKRPPISDEAYEQLSKRLDELARMEEEAEEEAKNPKPMKIKKASKQTSSSGWKKGFLTSSNAKTPKAKAKPRKKTSAVSRPMNDETTIIERSVGKNSSSSVSFDTTQNQIQEIPRVGTQPVPPKTGSSKSLQESIFSGIIEERPVIQERPVVRGPQPTKPKKKLSRFARERQNRANN